jgi:hypothetical protein
MKIEKRRTDNNKRKRVFGQIEQVIDDDDNDWDA